MLLAAATLALALSAPPEKTPYWPPRAASGTDKLKCDYATVLVMSLDKGEFRGTTPAGVVTYKVGPAVQVFGRDGRPAGGAATLKAGDKVRVYYLVEDGARVVEADLE
jgi:hypothetical protein